MRSKGYMKRGREGTALITALIVGVVLVAAGAGVICLAGQESYIVGRIRDQIKAQAIAEAGANEAYSILRENFAKRFDPNAFPAREFDGGTYQASVKTYEDDPTKATITVVASYGSASVTVKCDVKDFAAAEGGEGGGGSGSEPPPRSSPWAHTVLCNGYITHNGSGECYGSVHANNYITVNGSMNWGADDKEIVVSACSASKGFKANGSCSIHGTVMAPKIQVNGSKHIHQEVVGPVDVVAFPDLGPQLAELYQIALANGQVYNGNLSINGTENWGSVPGGVRWINGTFTQNGSLTYSGAIIATGNIRFNGSVNHTKQGNLPAMVSRDGSITVNGSHTVQGLVYAKTDVTWNGAGSISGAILCGGNMTFNGSYGLLEYSYCMPGTDDGSGSGGGGSGSGVKPEVAITCWHR